MSTATTDLLNQLLNQRDSAIAEARGLAELADDSHEGDYQQTKRDIDLLDQRIANARLDVQNEMESRDFELELAAPADDYDAAADSFHNEMMELLPEPIVLGEDDYDLRFDAVAQVIRKVYAQEYPDAHPVYVAKKSRVIVAAIFTAIGVEIQCEELDDGFICGELVKETLTELKRLEIPRDMPLDQVNTVWHTGHVGDDWGVRHGAVDPEDDCPTGCEIAMTVQGMRIHNEITEDGENVE